MIILAIDTSERYTSETMPHAGSLGLFEPDPEALREISRLSLDPGTDHAADLAASIGSLLKSAGKAGKKPRDVELVVITKGPGSFTGLRVGVSTAKTFAFALGIRAVGVNTLDAIAQNTPPDYETAYVTYDARRGYVYAAAYRRSGGRMRRDGDYTFLPSTGSAAKIPDGAAVFGPGCAAYPDDFPDALTDPGLSRVRIESVVALAVDDYHAGAVGGVHDLNPLYLRPSAAEEGNKETRKQGNKETRK